MPDAGIDPIQLGLLSGDPTAALQAQRKLALAQALQGMALGGPQQPQQLGLEGTRYPHAARVGPLAAVAPLIEAMMANKGFKTALPAMANVYGQAGQAFQDQQVPGTSLQPAAPTSGSQDVQPLVQRLPGASLDQTVQASQPQTVHSPLNPLGLPPNLALQAWLKDPAKYADLIAGTPEWRTALAATGGNSQAAMHMLQAEAAKKGTVELRSGGTALIPDGQGGYTRIRAPNLPPGFEPQYDAQGNYVGTQAAPGLAQGEGEVARAKELGETRGKINVVPTAGGGSKVLLPEGFGGEPRAGNAGGGRYFPPSQNGSGATSSSTTRAPPPSGTTPGIWDQVPVRPSSNALGVDPYLEKRIGKMADKDDELSTKYGSEADLADQRIAFNNEALKVIQNAELGPLSARLTRVRQMAIESGIPADWVPGADTVNSTTELGKFAVRNPLLQLKPTFGSRPSTAEFQVLKTEANPSPEMLQGAYVRLAQLDNQAAGFTKQRAADYAYYTDAMKGNPQRFEGWYANKVPFAKWLSDNPLGRAGEAHVNVSSSFATESEAQAARGRGEIQNGDRIVVGGKPATWRD